MKKFRKAIREINSSIAFLMWFETVLNTIVFFLIVYLFLSMINVYPMAAAIPAAVFFFVRIFSKSRVDKKRMVEQEYKPLREKLRTAADNMKESNPVVDELQEEVVHDLKNVTLSSFLNTKSIFFKIAMTMVLSFAIVFTTTMNLYVVDFNSLIASIPDILEQTNPVNRGKTAPLGEINETDDIYGDSKLAVLGDDQIDIKIQPVNYEVSVREEGDLEQKQFDEMFPTEVAIEQSSAFEERIPEEQQELVKNYFNELAS